MDVRLLPEEPGAITVRPTRADAERSAQEFYTLLEALRDPHVLPLRKIAAIIGDTSLNPEPNILRKIQNRTLSDDARRYLLRHIFDEENLISGKLRRQLAAVDDGLYFAILIFLELQDVSQDTARGHVVGAYRFWRYSADRPDEFVLGRQVFYEDPKTRALKVELTLVEHAVEGVPRTRQRFVAMPSASPASISSWCAAFGPGNCASGSFRISAWGRSAPTPTRAASSPERKTTSSPWMATASASSPGVLSARPRTSPWSTTWTNSRGSTERSIS
jgi:hypothetical protein